MIGKFIDGLGRLENWKEYTDDFLGDSWLICIDSNGLFEIGFKRHSLKTENRRWRNAE